MSDGNDEVATREAAVHEGHHWVRLTSACNNRCRFCLDARSRAGRHLEREAIEEQLRAGRHRGAARLILSGGEATTHPDFIEFVRLGRQLGYSKVQTITNGRMFSYAKFLRASLDAGLQEITFSIHGHDAALHDELVGVPGAFEQATAGLRAALADGRPVVNIDVCLNAANIEHLPTLLDRFIAMGVREFDLLHLIPFGRAFDSGLTYDIEAAMPAVQSALRLSERDDLHIWFNRFPPEYLEGHEHLIQDPHKLLDEVYGRREDFASLLRDGTPLFCREPERCDLCYLQGFCDRLDEVRRQLGAGDFDVWRVDAEDARRPSPVPVSATWLRAPTLERARALAPELPGAEIILELGEYDALPIRLGKPVCAAYVHRAEDLAPLLASAGFEVVASLNHEVALALERDWPAGHDGLVLVAPRFAKLSDARAGVDLSRFFDRYRAAVPVELVPACVSGRPPRAQPRILDSSILDYDANIDIERFVEWYVEHDYTLKGHRCRQCSAVERCAGAHVNWVRAYGFASLVPLP